MPGIIQETPFQTISVKELHPTFGAEVIGVNFPNPDEEQRKEVLAAMAKVRSVEQMYTNSLIVANVTFLVWLLRLPKHRNERRRACSLFTTVR